MRAPRSASLLLAGLLFVGATAAPRGAASAPEKPPAGAAADDAAKAADLPAAERLLASRERALGPEHALVATALQDLAALYQARRDFERAEPLLLRALQIREKLSGAEHLAVAEVLYSLAVLYRKTRIFERAEPCFLRALRIREKALGADALAVADVLNDLGLLYRRVRLDERAEQTFRRAIQIREKALGPEDPKVAVTLNHLAMLYWARGELERSEPLLLRALSIDKAKLGRDDPEIAAVLKNLAVLYRDRGEYEQAEACFQQTIDLLEAARGPEDPDVANPLYNLAKLYRKRKQIDRAEEVLLRALFISQATVGLDHPAVGYCQNELGVLCSMRGDYAHAEPMLLRAVSVLEKGLGPEHPDVASALNDLALMYLWKGEIQQAEPRIRRALAIQERAFGPDHPDVATTMSVLAGYHVLRGNIAEAVQARARGATIRDQQAATLLATGSEKRKRAYMATLRKDTDATVSLHAFSAPADPEAAKVALTTILRRKGRVLDAMADSFLALRRHLTPEGQGLLDKLAAVVSELSTLASRDVDSIAAEERLARIRQREEERQRLEAEVSFRSAEFRADQHLVTIEQVQAAIPEGTALVEIFLYRPFDGRPERAADHWGAPRYVAYRLSRRGGVASTDLGEAARVDALVSVLREALADPSLDPRKAARALDEAVMRPVRALLGDTRQIWMSPDSELNLVPFGALIDEDGRYLIDRYGFTYLTSGRDLIRFEARAPAREGPVVMANPAFGAIPRPTLMASRGGRAVDLHEIAFPPLPGTAAEARVLQKRIEGVRVLTGADATEANLKALHAPRIVHIATHGFFLPSAEAAGASGHPGDRGVVAASMETAIDNPLLRAGLAFAGANVHESGKDDGVLTALEAASLDLYGTKLIVLSACETGIGQVQGGDGVYGLRRALVMAGAETQVMSLWKVDDDATRALMEAYYAELNAGAGRSAAMREVALRMRQQKKTAHPYYWASFIVSGAASPLEQPAARPAVAVPPGARGHCTCEAVGDGRGRGAGAGAALLTLGLAGALGRRWAQRRRALIA